MTAIGRGTRAAPAGGLTVALSLVVTIMATTGCSAHDTAAQPRPTPTTPVVAITAMTGLPAPPPVDLSGLPGVTEKTLPDCWVHVTAETAVLGFDKNSAELPTDPQGRAALAQILERFRGAGQVEVHGHSSGEGSPTRNVGLARERAEAVAAAGRLVLPDVDFQARGHGSEDPLVAEDGTEATRTRNRRVELVGRVPQCG